MPGINSHYLNSIHRSGIRNGIRGSKRASRNLSRTNSSPIKASILFFKTAFTSLKNFLGL